MLLRYRSAPSTPGAPTPVGRQSYENSDADGDRKGDQWAMLDLIGQAAQRSVAELGRLATEFRRFIAHRTGPVAKPISDRAQGRSDGLAEPVGGLPRTGGGPSARAFERCLECPQAPVDFADVGGDGARIS